MEKRRLLVAGTPIGCENASRALRDDFDVVPVFSFRQAVGAIKESEADGILCNIEFDGPRTFEVFREAKKLAPHVPLVSCELIPSRLDPKTIRRIVRAASDTGAIGFIDYNSVLEEEGRDAADEHLRSELARLLESVGVWCSVPRHPHRISRRSSTSRRGWTHVDDRPQPASVEPGPAVAVSR